MKAVPSLKLVAIYSRSKANSQALATAAGGDVEAYFDSDGGSGGGANSKNPDGLGDLLKRSDIDAVIIALPIPVQPPVIRRCLLCKL